MKSITEMNKEVEQAEAELEKCSQVHQGVEAKLAEHAEVVAKIQTEIEDVENEVFASFCEEISIPNIRLYEEQGLPVMTERVNKRLQFEKQKSRIQSQIEYEKSWDKEGDVEKWKEALETQQRVVEEAQKKEREKVSGFREEKEEALEAIVMVVVMFLFLHYIFCVGFPLALDFFIIFFFIFSTNIFFH